MNPMAPLAEWQTFYEIMGSSAGALIGLQFVVTALIANIPNLRPDENAGNAFATPNIVHFGAVLLMAGIMTAPWHTTAALPVLWIVAGAIGVLYSLIVTRRMRQTRYQPEFEDWLCHSVLPLLGYATLIGAGCAAFNFLRPATFAIAAAALLLLFTGIHNAWDTAAYHVFVQRYREPKP